MNTQKHLHPMNILQSIVRIITNNFIFIILLFVIKARDSSTFLTSLRLILISYIIVQCILAMIKWWKTTYEFTEEEVHQYRGLFKKKHHYMRLDQIENIQQHTPFYLKIFGLTSLTLNTRSTDAKASITFETLSKNEATWMKEFVDSFRKQEVYVVENQADELTDFEGEKATDEVPSNRKLHFSPDTKSLIKASFLSLNLLILMLIIATLYDRVQDILPIDQYVEKVYGIVTESWISIGLTVIVLIIISVVIGFVKTFLTYGNYEITSDDEHLYIQSGMINEKHISIRKTNVQGIRIFQSPLKKWLGMSEIMLISTATDEDDLGSQSLFPFLSTKQVRNLIQELFPHIHIVEATKKLPKNALWMKMIRLPWVFLFASAWVWMFNSKWIFLLPIIFITTYASRYFDYRNSRYTFGERSVQLYSGGMFTSAFHTNRKQVIEIEMKQSLLQRKFGLASIQTTNKSTPPHEESIHDISVEDAKEFVYWYGRRAEEVTLQQLQFQKEK